MRMPLLFLSYGNSMIYAFGTAFFATLIAIPTGYALARWKSIWMKILFWCCVVLLFLPTFLPFCSLPACTQKNSCIIPALHIK